MTARFTLSAFGDEIAEDVDEQLAVLNDLGIRYLELRSAWEPTCSNSLMSKWVS